MLHQAGALGPQIYVRAALCQVRRGSGTKQKTLGQEEAACAPGDPLLLQASRELPGSLWEKGKGFYWRRQWAAPGLYQGPAGPVDFLVEVCWRGWDRSPGELARIHSGVPSLGFVRRLF